MEKDTKAERSIQQKIVWRNVVIMTLLHVTSVYALTQLHRAYFVTIVWEFLYYMGAGLGITAGAHRLWSHRSYKAKLPLRILLAVFNSMAIQNSIMEWARDHRGHHKFSESDADPHNAKRGFFFSHVGWLLVKKHPDVKSKGKSIDLSDLYNDPVVTFQEKYYLASAVLLSLVVPTVVPLLWNESLGLSYIICVLRICMVFNATWCVNSLAHLWGNRPYDKYINPAENKLVSFMAMGEGFHNYHHVFPHDYTTSEYGLRLNVTTMFINFMVFVGWAYDCRKMEPKTILARRKRTGDFEMHSTNIRK